MNRTIVSLATRGLFLGCEKSEQYQSLAQSLKDELQTAVPPGARGSTASIVELGPGGALASGCHSQADGNF